MPLVVVGRRDGGRVRDRLARLSQRVEERDRGRPSSRSCSSRTATSSGRPRSRRRRPRPGRRNEQLWLDAVGGARGRRRSWPASSLQGGGPARRFVINLVLGVLLVMAVVNDRHGKGPRARAPVRWLRRRRGDSPAPSLRRRRRRRPRRSRRRGRSATSTSSSSTATPNQQTLKENYNHDNSYFIDGLRDRGFFVASKSRGPYPKTPHSIQTTLNMEFVDLPKESKDWQLVYDKLKNPKIARSS